MPDSIVVIYIKQVIIKIIIFYLFYVNKKFKSKVEQGVLEVSAQFGLKTTIYVNYEKKKRIVLMKNLPGKTRIENKIKDLESHGIIYTSFHEKYNSFTIFCLVKDFKCLFSSWTNFEVFKLLIVVPYTRFFSIRLN